MESSDDPGSGVVVMPDGSVVQVDYDIQPGPVAPPAVVTDVVPAGDGDDSN